MREQQPVDSELLGGHADERVDAGGVERAGQHQMGLVRVDRPQQHREARPAVLVAGRDARRVDDHDLGPRDPLERELDQPG